MHSVAHWHLLFKCSSDRLLICEAVNAGQDLHVLQRREHVWEPVGQHVCLGSDLHHSTYLPLHLYQRP